jgi:hypothetical protein
MTSTLLGIIFTAAMTGWMMPGAASGITDWLTIGFGRRVSLFRINH